MSSHKSVRAAAILAVVISLSATLSACTSLTYYLPRAQSVDDTLLVITVDRFSAPSVEYRVILADDTSIRVFPKYSETFVRGLPPGEHRAVRIVSGKPGGSFGLQSIDVDIPFTVRRGEITVFPTRFAVEWEKTRSARGVVTITQTCTFPNLTQADLTGVRRAFDRNTNARSWEGFPFAPLQPSEVPESTSMVWQDSYQSDPAGTTCFPAGTTVITPGGAREIQTLSVGDMVRAFDPETGGWEQKEIRQFFTHQFVGNLITITAGGENITATPEHPFWTVGGSGGGTWSAAEDLEAGSVLLTEHGSVPVVAVSRKPGQLIVYNIEVEEFHTYSVGSRGFVVHNKGSEESGE